MKEETELKISPLKLGLSYAGCFLGVGYISGRELWTFFGGYGWGGFLGAGIVLALQLISGVMLIRLANQTGENRVEALIVRFACRPLRLAVGIIQALMMFFAMSVMVAGSGALVNQLFGWPAWLGSMVFALLVGYVGYRGLGTLLNVFSAVVPVLVGLTAVICVLTLLRTDPAGITLPRIERADPVMNRWYGAALLFFSYNIFASIGVLTPIGCRLRSRRTAWAGILLGTLLLSVMTFGILSALTAVPESLETEMPMLLCAQRIRPALGAVFALLLLGGMFGTASNCSLYTLSVLTAGDGFPARHRFLTVLAVMSVSLSISFFGFSGLIGTMYPIFGYFGVFMFALLLEHYFHARREKRQE